MNKSLALWAQLFPSSLSVATRFMDYCSVSIVNDSWYFCYFVLTREKNTTTQLVIFMIKMQHRGLTSDPLTSLLVFVFPISFSGKTRSIFARLVVPLERGDLHLQQEYVELGPYLQNGWNTENKLSMFPSIIFG